MYKHPNLLLAEQNEDENLVHMKTVITHMFQKGKIYTASDIKAWIAYNRNVINGFFFKINSYNYTAFLKRNAEKLGIGYAMQNRVHVFFNT